MANSQRRPKDKGNTMFIAMNIDGGYYFDTNFIDSFKVAAMITMAFLVAVSIAWIKSLGTPLFVNIIMYLILFLIVQWVIRYYILEEKYYFKMYNIMKNASVTDTDIFWNVASIKETNDGAILIYSDMRIGVLIKLSRDTIIGRGEDFKENNYDAISEFYRALNTRQYKFVQMNIMEQIGNDPRIERLEELAEKPTNENLKSLMRLQVGHIKKVTRANLSESDYILVHTEQTARADSIIEDTIDCASVLMEGAFVGFSVLNLKDIIDLHKQMYGVRYFDYSKATMKVYKYINAPYEKPFKIKKVIFKDGKSIELSQNEINRINSMASTLKDKDPKDRIKSIREALDGKGYNRMERLDESMKDRANEPDTSHENIGGTSDPFSDILGWTDEIEKNREELDREIIEF